VGAPDVKEDRVTLRLAVLAAAAVACTAAVPAAAAPPPTLGPLQQANLRVGQGVCEATGGTFEPQGIGGTGGYLCDGPTGRVGRIPSRLWCALAGGTFVVALSTDYECVISPF
jgi:hypothetical protein